MVPNYSRGNDFTTIIILDQKMFDENFWSKPIPEELTLQAQNIFDQKIDDENFWFKPILEEMIYQQ